MSFNQNDYVLSGYVIDKNVDLDINGDGKVEKLLSYSSEASDRWKMRIFEEKNWTWEIIKEDQESLGGKRANPYLLDIHDFGNDRKQEVIVGKISGTTIGSRFQNIRYYVFGSDKGVYGDYPIARGYLHPEWFDGTISISTVKVTGNQIIETYDLELPDQNNVPLSDVRHETIQVIQQYQNGTFASQPKILKNEWSDISWKNQTQRYIELGIWFEYNCDSAFSEKRITQKNMEGILLSNDYCDEIFIKRKSDFNPKEISTFGGMIGEKETVKKIFWTNEYGYYRESDGPGYSYNYFIKRAEGDYYVLSFTNYAINGKMKYDEKTIEWLTTQILTSLKFQ